MNVHYHMFKDSVEADSLAITTTQNLGSVSVLTMVVAKAIKITSNQRKNVHCIANNLKVSGNHCSFSCGIANRVYLYRGKETKEEGREFLLVRSFIASVSSQHPDNYIYSNYIY